MKKIIRSILLITAITALCFCLGLSAGAESEEVDGIYYYYTVENDEATIYSVSANTSNTNLAIPESLGGYPVTSLSDSLISNNFDITCVTIPASVTKIGEGAFQHVFNLIEINVKSQNPAYSSKDGVLFNKDKTTLICYPQNKADESYKVPYGVKTISDGAFYDCDNIKHLEIAPTVETIGRYAFYSCHMLNDVTFTAPCSLKVIDAYGFYNCYNMAQFSLPETVTTIGHDAFYGCSTSKNLDFNISANVTSIGEKAFCNSGYLNINVAEDNAFYSSVDGVLFNKDKTTLIAYPVYSYRSTYTVPSTVTTISDYAFYEGDILNEIVLPESVTSIGKQAFYYCYNLGKINIPNGVETINESAFSYCRCLTEMDIPDSVTTIESLAFFNCDALQKVTIGSGLNNLRPLAFDDCDKLDEVVISTENSTYCAEDGVIFSKDKSTLVLYLSGNNASAYTIPSYVSKIGDYSFYNDYDIKELNIPYSVTAIGDYAFYNCNGIVSITIPGSVANIGISAFDSCYNLTDITLEDGIKSIGTYAFRYCNSLYDIYIPYTVTEIGADLFGWRNSEVLVYCYPDSSIVTYAENNYIRYTLIDEAEGTVVKGTEGDLSWTLNKSTGVLEITGNGEMPNYYNGGTSSWANYRFYIKSVTIGKGVKNVGAYAFKDFTKLKKITVASTVTTIGYGAFYNCSLLNSINFNGGVKTIEEEAFYNCSSITDLIIPDGVETIQSRAFYHGNYKTLTLPSSVKYIGDGAFYTYDNELEAVYITDLAAWCAIEFDHYEANPLLLKDDITLYHNNKPVENLVIPEGTELINDYAFTGYRKLKSVSIPASVTKIGKMPFAFCLRLESITVDENSENFLTDERGVLFDKKMVELIQYPIGQCSEYMMEDFNDEIELIKYISSNMEKFEYKVPDTVINICDFAFAGAYFLFEIDLPDGVQTIGDGAFMESMSIYHMRIPGTIREFSGDNNIAFSIEFCEGITSINTEDGVNIRLDDLLSILIPSTVEKIGDGFFTEADYGGLEDIGDVFYAGSQEDWYEIIGDNDRACLEANNVRIHYNAYCDGHEYTSEYYEKEDLGDFIFGIKRYTCKNCGWYYFRYAFEKTGHKHEYYNAGVTPPTCTAKGYTTYTCTCGESYVDNYTDKLDHEYTSEITTPATHLAEGVKTFTCSCGDSYTEAIAKLTEHNYTSEVTKAATHLEEGLKTYTCACGDTYTEAIAKLAEHTYEAVVTAPTCSAKGYTTYTCACGESYVDDYTDKLEHEYTSEITTPATHLTEGVKTFTCDCGDTYTEAVARLEGHTYTSEITKEATHLEEGETTYTCACGDSYTEAIAKLTEHTYEAVVTAPTCSAKGYTTYTCACGDTYTAEEVDATGHSYSSEVTVAPTHLKEGIITYTCACGDSYTEAIAKLTEHSYKETVIAPTCTETGYTLYECVCGKSYKGNYTGVAEHSYLSRVTRPATHLSTGLRSNTCTECGDTYTEIIAKLTEHTYEKTVKTPTCTKAGYTTYTCACGDTYTGDEKAALGHKYTNACDTTCNTCSAKRSITHSYKAATCTAPKTCKVCKATTGKANGHKYTNACDTACNTCGAKRSISHAYKTVVTTKATLSKNGKTVSKCSVCGAVKSGSTKTVYYPKTIKLSATSYVYNGKKKTPSVTVKDSKGNTLKKDTDYTVKYSSGRKSTGKYTVTITFKGKYSGTKTLTFTIVPKAVTLSKVTAGSKQATVTWKTVTGASGYQVQYSTSSKFKSAKTATVSGKSAKKTTIKSLKKGKKYYFRVRAYKTVNGSKIYGAWSSAKNVKVK